jgi:hypothetical protein
MECRLHQDSRKSWHCQVLIRSETDSQGKALHDVSEAKFGDPIYDTEELEDRIRRAQQAVLNPWDPIESFLADSKSDNSRPRLAFSSNVVCVDVWGPKVPDLTFIDLPGKLLRHYCIDFNLMCDRSL